jgi:mono/diheme cytochrome c family protein
VAAGPPLSGLRAVVTVAAVALAGLATGCGSGGGATASKPDARSLFLAAGCGGCHTLAAAGSHGTAGTNLDDARPGYGLSLERIRDGRGSMPSFAGSLTAAQIRQLARFVAGATR